ncbi:MAG: nucleotidyltransferase domain-containing protein [Candidatus Berkelbacteria bacterium]|nr:nucleotidyltransferase domain-containing protein [Candidatus Berkelbacteria bacterium]
MPNEKDLQIAKEIKKELKKKLGNKLVSVILYGSRARGTAKKDSDMDLFLLTKRKIKSFGKDDDLIIDLETDYQFEKNLDVQIFNQGVSEFKKNKERLFYREVAKGVRL